MSKKLLMNNGVDKDVIVLCKDFSPNGQPFYLWQDKMIDWDKYELYINVDISAITSGAWRNILTISSTDITSWAGTGKLHLYGTMTTIRIQAVNAGTGNTAMDISLLDYNKQRIQVVINRNGIYLDEKLKYSAEDTTLMRIVMNKLKTSNVTIGSAIQGDYSICTYNKVSLRKYVERGE